MQGKLKVAVKIIIISVIFIIFIIPVNMLRAEIYTDYLDFDPSRYWKIESGTQKAVYLTGYNIGDMEKRKEIYKLIQETELNSIVFDVKDDTGDIGYVDKDGYFFITDRKKDLIIKAGENISPREIEEVLYHHPKIQEAAVAHEKVLFVGGLAHGLDGLASESVRSGARLPVREKLVSRDRLFGFFGDLGGHRSGHIALEKWITALPIPLP